MMVSIRCHGLFIQFERAFLQVSIFSAALILSIQILPYKDKQKMTYFDAINVGLLTVRNRRIITSSRRVGLVQKSSKENVDALNVELITVN